MLHDDAGGQPFGDSIELDERRVANRFGYIVKNVSRHSLSEVILRAAGSSPPPPENLLTNHIVIAQESGPVKPLAITRISWTFISASVPTIYALYHVFTRASRRPIL